MEVKFKNELSKEFITDNYVPKKIASIELVTHLKKLRMALIINIIALLMVLVGGVFSKYGGAFIVLIFALYNGWLYKGVNEELIRLTQKYNL